MKTVAVTGGTGFIGSHTVEALLQEGYRVRCLIRSGRSGTGWLKGLPVEIRGVDLLDRSAVRAALDQCDQVVHIAGVTRAKRRKDFFTGNVDPTRNILLACKELGTVSQFCYISSLTAVGPGQDGRPVNEDSPCHPFTAYGASKLEAELVCREFEDLFPVVILRPPAVYGPRDKDILHMFRWIKFGIMPVMGPSKKMLSMIYVTELARAITTVLKSDSSGGRVYFVGDKTPYLYSDLVSITASLLGKTTFNLPIPRLILYGIAGVTQAISWLLPQPSVVSIDKVRDLVTPYWTCETGKIERELGFRTEIGAGDGLQRTLEWYKAEGWL
ncbi:MAG: NAD-dependent epimerase/dehydratase family protein [Bacteroidota bacterium]